MVFENGVKNIQAAAYNGARTVDCISQTFFYLSGYHDGKRYICDQCSVEYASMSSLRKHTETVHGKIGSNGEASIKPIPEHKTYKCQECNTG